MLRTITGDNDLAIKQKLEEITKDFVAKYGDLAVEKYDASNDEVGAAIESLTSLPFLSDKKLVIIRDFLAVKEFSEKLEASLKDIPEQIDVVFVEPKLDKRLGLYKVLQKETEFINLSGLEQKNLPGWIVQTTKERGGTISLSDATYLVEAVGSNQMMLSSEIDKLVIYKPTITRESIDLLVEKSPQSSVFDLINAAFDGRREKALVLYEEQRVKNVEPQQIISLINWQLNILALIKFSKGKTSDQIASDSKLNPYPIRRSKSIADNMPVSKLRALVSDLLNIDIQLKTSRSDPDELLKNYILLMSS
ncbi:MAG TPA: DNA polymerase III subunit delta [Candidatus Sulfotelmatobacter sp.]|nr:DNA polymerase III subunit delta [Candidatus Sulfotelmatobacter sp.]